jgi:ABC-2 type transport system permease protein
MIALFKKEVRAFLGSMIGYVVILTFLLMVSLMLWIFPGDFNLLDAGYAGLDNLFLLAPWVYMFLIPAITMRSFAEEKRNGTLELLFTKPISDFQIILAKFFAGMVLVMFSITPTLVFYYTVYQLGNPAGNLDLGATIGSYIGLVLLATGFVSIGIFASSLTQSQIVSFILAVFLSFVFYLGFDSLSGIALFEKMDYIILQFGINYHFLSLSRGVIDTRDLLYFIGLSALFMLATRTVLESRKW